jgi:decaprenylphospho-beta-D-erythro-pentofuranosid-2-ulose 2-reductase
MQRILIVGANSGMAEAAARIWAARGDTLYLVARNRERLAALAADLQIRGARVAGYAQLDVNEFHRHAEVVDQAVQALGGLEIALVAHGSLADQKRAQSDPVYAIRELSTNGTSVAGLCTLLANVLEARGAGTLAVISSVAGERGRQSNYVYGAAKALVTAFTQGLRNRLASRGVCVCTIKPGYVSTAMTAHLPRNALFASAATAGRCIVDAIDRRRDVAYVPGFWALIMAVVRAIPEPVFKRLKL